MSTSHRWQKILKDTNHVGLSEQQIFWRSIAQLRLGKYPEALHTFEKLAAKQFSKVDFKLHAAELYLKNNLIQQGEQLLIQTYSKIHSKKPQLKQWHFIAKRYPNPSPELTSLINRDTEFNKDKLVQNFNDPLSWERGQKLKVNINNPEYYLAWLDWSLQNNATTETLCRILETTLQFLPNKGYLCYQFFQKLKNQNLWPQLIHHLFPQQHRGHAQPESMWQQWWNACPDSFRNLLRQKMSDTLNRHPNMKLEKLIESFSQ